MKTEQIPTARFIPTADLKAGDATVLGEVTAIRRTAKTTFITVAPNRDGQGYTYRQATISNIFAATKEG